MIRQPAAAPRRARRAAVAVAAAVEEEEEEPEGPLLRHPMRPLPPTQGAAASAALWWLIVDWVSFLFLMFVRHFCFQLLIRCPTLKLCLLFGLDLHAHPLNSMSFGSCLLARSLSVSLAPYSLHLSQPEIWNCLSKLENVSS